MTINTDYDPQADFSAFRTYKWAERTPRGDDDPRVYNDITAGRIKLAVSKALQAKGFQETQANPDFLVGWHGAIQGQMAMDTIHDNYGYGYGWYGPSPGMGTSTTTVRQWDEGTLLIDIVDAKTNALVWRGSAQAELSENKSPEQEQAKLDSAAQRILQNFPPR
jgi:hypothetical protein